VGRFSVALEEDCVVSADGTRLKTYRVGRGPRVWLMPPAMGAPLISMRGVIEPLSDECTFLTWDMRGFFGSGAAPRDDAYALRDHVDDLEAVLETHGSAPFILGGWSMAVPISLEYLRRDPSRVSALVLINGPFEHMIRHALPFPGSTRVFTSTLKTLGRPLGAAITEAAKRVLGMQGFGTTLAKVGFIRQNAAQFEEVLAEFRLIDWTRYLVVMRELAKHSARDVLPSVRVPTLITAGTRDFMMPVRAAREMHRLIPGSELFLVEGGTHYTPTEFPGALASRIKDFLAARVPRPDRAAGERAPHAN
jgi:pimeloyl-ACP methyl ester carboxylesterase